MCNGTNECADGKDEDAGHCVVIKTGSCTPAEQAKNFCDHSFDVIDGENMTHTFLCQSDTVRKNGSVSVACYNNVWTPTSTRCTRICQPIVIQATNITCHHNGKEVNCSQPLLIGTKINTQCEPSYHPTHSEVTCRGDGSWEVGIVECIPECGRRLKEKTRNITSLRSVEYREFPWSVIVYYTKPGSTTPMPILGTIISPYLVITTAINFDPEYREELLSPDSTIVIVAKRTKDPEVTDDQFQNTYKVKDIYFTTNGYQESENSTTSENIAIIELQENIVLSPSVFPACVNWGNNETLYPNEDTVGQIPHIVASINGNASEHEILQTIALRYISRIECLDIDSMKSTSQMIRTDNFCTEPIPDPAPGDGAFIFQESNTNLFFVQGLVDGVISSDSSPPKMTNTYVDLSAYMNWIKVVRKHTEDRFINEIWLQVEAENQTVICGKNFTSNDSYSNGLKSWFGDEGPSTSTNGCKLPNKKEINASNFTISCDSSVPESKCQKIRENTLLVPEYTILRIECENGYGMNSNKEVVCFKNKWMPEITSCQVMNNVSNIRLQSDFVEPSHHKPSNRKQNNSLTSVSNSQSVHSSSINDDIDKQRENIDTSIGNPIGKKLANSQKSVYAEIPQKLYSQNNNSANFSSPAQILPDELDYEKIPDQVFNPSSRRPVYVRVRNGFQKRPTNQVTEQSSSENNEGYITSSLQPSTRRSEYQQTTYKTYTYPDYMYSSSQPPFYSPPTSDFKRQPYQNQLPVSYDYVQGQDYTTSVKYNNDQDLSYSSSSIRSVNRKSENGYIQPFPKQFDEDYGYSQRPSYQTFLGFHPDTGNLLIGNSNPSTLSSYGKKSSTDSKRNYTLLRGSQNQAPINWEPGIDKQTQIRSDHPYGQQIPTNLISQNYSANDNQLKPDYTKSVQQPITSTGEDIGLRGSFNSVNEEGFPYQQNYGGIQDHIYRPSSNKLNTNGIQLPEGYQPQVPSEGNNWVTKPNIYYSVSQQLPSENKFVSTDISIHNLSPKYPVHWRQESTTQAQTYNPITEQSALINLGVRQDFNVSSKKFSDEGSYGLFNNQNRYVTSQSPFYQITYDQDLNQGINPPSQTSLPSNIYKSEKGLSSCSSEGFFSILNDCTHFYRCVPSGRSFSKIVFNCGEGTVWDSNMNTCNHAWAVQRPDCRQGH